MRLATAECLGCLKAHSSMNPWHSACADLLPFAYATRRTLAVRGARNTMRQ